MKESQFDMDSMYKEELKSLNILIKEKEDKIIDLEIELKDSKVINDKEDNSKEDNENKLNKNKIHSLEE